MLTDTDTQSKTFIINNTLNQKWLKWGFQSIFSNTMTTIDSIIFVVNKQIIFISTTKHYVAIFATKATPSNSWDSYRPWFQLTGNSGHAFLPFSSPQQ